MHKIHELLNQSVQTFRLSARTEAPAFAAIPIEIALPNKTSGTMWQFYTDTKKVYLQILDPDKLQAVFDENILKMYVNAYGIKNVNVDNLFHDLFTYLNWHEVIHPLRIPDSDLDTMLIDDAIFRGIKKSGKIEDADLLHKVAHVRNAVWDFGVDHFFFTTRSLEERLNKLVSVRKKHPSRMPDGVIPMFDVAEISSHKDDVPIQGKRIDDSMFYPLTRLMYGLLFSRQNELRKSLRDFFMKSITLDEKECAYVIKNSLKGVISGMNPKQLNLLRVNNKLYFEAVEKLYLL